MERELVIDRDKCSTGQSPQRAVAPTEQEELVQGAAEKPDGFRNEITQ